jgi:hypothetical protein
MSWGCDCEFLEAQRKEAYAERNRCVALIARMAIARGFEAGLGKHTKEGGRDVWENTVFIDLPSGQVLWHISSSDLPMFDFLGKYKGEWDGHTAQEKEKRILNPNL